MNVGNLFNFNGRIGRAEMWLRSIIGGIAFSLVLLLFGTINSTGLAMTLMAVLYVAYFVFSLSGSIKRWHDRGKSGVWVFISLIPIVGWIWSFVELGFMPGTDGANEYGLPDSGSATSEPEPEPYVIPSRFS